MLILVLNETIDQVAMAYSVHCYGHVLRREQCHVLGRALDFEIEGQRKKWRLKRTYSVHEEKSMKVCLTRMMYISD